MSLLGGAAARAARAARRSPGVAVLRRVPGARPAAAEVRLERDTRRVLASGAFDRDWYELQTARTFDDERCAVRDYLSRGRRDGASPHPLFEPDWYRPDDWRSSRQDPLLRYLGKRSDWSRYATSVLFDGPAHLEAHSDAARHPGGPLGHFAQHATDATPFPLPHWPASAPQGRARPVTWGEVRAHLERATRSWLAQEELRRVPRRSDSFDRVGEEALRREAQEARAALADPSPGEPPLVSIVMPVWNRARAVRRAVESVQAQTWQDWELVVVDDGSSDDTPLVLEGLAAFDPRVRVVRSPHVGVSRARNTAIAAARGRYVAFLDSDNAWEPEFLATAVPVVRGRGLRAAYAAMELHDGGRVTYRAFDGGREHLLVGNHVDLNVLVVETRLLREVGGFAEDLRRTVDYDLVLKLSERTELALLPFVGAVYSEDAEDESRISVREPLTWDWVVRSRHLVDWHAVERAPRVPGRTSVVVPVRDDAPAAHRAVGALLDAGPGTDVDVLVLDSGSRRGSTLGLAALELLDRRVRVQRSVVDLGHALASDVALGTVRGEHVVLADPALVPEPGWLAPLRDALDGDAGDVAAAAPLVLSGDGTAEDAGLVFSSRAPLPVPLLRGHPVDDVERLGTPRPAALEARFVLARGADLVALRGYDCLLERGWHPADLSRRLGTATGRPGLAVVPASRAWRRPVGGSVARPAPVPGDDALVAARWAEVPRPDGTEWERAGFAVPHHATVVDRSGRREVRPVVVRPARTVADGPAAGLPSLRWAVKIAAPAGPRGRLWGDWHFARSLAAALHRLGQQVAVDTREAVRRPSSQLDDVELVLRGLDAVEPDAAKVRLLWVISHPDDVAPQELARYDGVLAASLSWAERTAAATGTPVEPLLQCTDPTVFRPELAEPDSGAPVLFIGNSRGIYRPVVRHALEAGIDLHVYGSGWDGWIDPRFVRGLELPGADVARSYRAASVVLNDHWDDMRREGFLSNRLFDVTAAGGRLLSDRVEGAEELLGGSVRTWGSGEELAELLRAPVAEVFPGEERLRENAARVAAEHSFDARARRLLEVALAHR